LLSKSWDQDNLIERKPKKIIKLVFQNEQYWMLKLNKTTQKKMILTHANFSILVIQIIKPEASYLKKIWSLILNISNVKGWNWKKKLQLYKRIKKK
jgi:hypothetical protein